MRSFEMKIGRRTYEVEMKEQGNKKVGRVLWRVGGYTNSAGFESREIHGEEIVQMLPSACSVLNKNQRNKLSEKLTESLSV